MPRSRAARDTRPRSVPGADGIAISTSSGSTSSRMRGQVVAGRAEHLDALDARAVQPRVVVDEAERREAELRVEQHLAQQQPAARAGADDDHAARVAARAEAAQPPLVERAGDHPRAEHERERQQQVQRQHRRRDAQADVAAARRASRPARTTAT